jgi:hypothetical protein
MDKIEYYAVIKFIVKEGLTPNEIIRSSLEFMGTLLLRFQQLRNGLLSLNLAVPALKMIRVKDVQKVQQHQKSLNNMVLDDRRIKVREIAETIGISKEHVGYILHEELDMKKLCARWVPRLLSADQKRTCMKISEQCLERFNRNKTDFVGRIITFNCNTITQHFDTSQSCKCKLQYIVIYYSLKSSHFIQF